MQNSFKRLIKIKVVKITIISYILLPLILIYYIWLDFVYCELTSYPITSLSYINNKWSITINMLSLVLGLIPIPFLILVYELDLKNWWSEKNNAKLLHNK